MGTLPSLKCCRMPDMAAGIGAEGEAVGAGIAQW